MLKNSYIFLSREKKKKKIQKTEKNVIVIDFLPSFSELLKNSFDNIIFEPKEKSICFIGAVVLKIDYNNKCVNVYFKYYNVWSNYYLDIIVKENKMIDNINVLDIIKEKSNRVKDNNISKKDYYIKSSFYSLDYNDIETLLFTKSVTEEERLEVESFLIENKDLTKI